MLRVNKLTSNKFYKIIKTNLTRLIKNVVIYFSNTLKMVKYFNFIIRFYLKIFSRFKLFSSLFLLFFTGYKNGKHISIVFIVYIIHFLLNFAPLLAKK